MPASVFFHVLPVTLWVATAPPQKKDNAGANDGDGDGDDDDDDTHTHVVV